MQATGLIVFGPKHPGHVAAEYLAYYHRKRPLQGKGNEPLITLAPPNAHDDIVCRERLGGLLRHYYRRAASLPEPHRGVCKLVRN